jgi:hypothetical protein
MIKAAYINILENSAVTLAAAAEDGSFPLTRLYDRDVGRMFKTTAAVTTVVHIDQGATGNLAVDQMFIPSGHNLSGMTLDIEYSDDDIAYTPATAQFVAAAGLIDKSWADETHRYWKFTITAPGIIPQFAELFLTNTYSFERNPEKPWGPRDEVKNVENATTAGGQDRFLVHGEPKRRRAYTLPNVGETQKDNLITLDDAWAGSNPFWLEDHEGVWIYGNFEAPMNMTEITEQRYALSFSFLEVLP